MNLFGKEPRPVFNEQMEDELADIVGKKVFDWCAENNQGCGLQECVAAAKEVLSWRVHNGYEIAKEFEDELGISPTPELCELLDDCSWEASDILKEHVKRWVKTDDIKPELKIGDIVNSKVNGKNIQGEIVEIYEKVAQYGVCVESLGQIKGKNHYCLNYEDCQLVLQQQN